MVAVSTSINLVETAIAVSTGRITDPTVYIFYSKLSMYAYHLHLPLAVKDLRERTSVVVTWALCIM